MRRFAAATLLLCLALTGCSQSGDDEASGAATASDDSGDLAEGGAGAGGGEGGGGEAATGDGAAVVPVGAVLASGRSVISIATAEIEVDDVQAAARRAGDLAATSGGFVASQQARLEDAQIDLTLRVPSSRFRHVLDGASELGEVVESDLTTEDVTEQVVDLESRVASGRASVERLRALLGEAGDVAQLAAVEAELARREGDLESLLGRLRVLEDQVDLSTIHLRLVAPTPVAAAGDDLPGFAHALGTGWDALVAVASLAVLAVGYSLPIVAVAAVVVLAASWFRRRVRPTAPAPTPAAD